MFHTPFLFSIVSGYTFPPVRLDKNKENRKRVREFNLFEVKQTITDPIDATKRRKIELIPALPEPNTKNVGKTKKVSGKLQNETEKSSINSTKSVG